MSAVNKAHPVNSDPFGSRQFAAFLLRWIVSAFAMWVCIRLFARISPDIDNFWTYTLAGLVFSLVNSVIKPFLTLLSLPFIVVTLGLFVLIVNATMVALTIWLIPGIYIDFGGAVLSAITISVINYLANFLVPSYNRH